MEGNERRNSLVCDTEFCFRVRDTVDEGVHQNLSWPKEKYREHDGVHRTRSGGDNNVAGKQADTGSRTEKKGSEASTWSSSSSGSGEQENGKEDEKPVPKNIVYDFEEVDGDGKGHGDGAAEDED